MAPEALPVQFLGTLSVRTREVERVGIEGGPFGTRSVATVTGGTFDGPGLRAELTPGVAAGDWITERDDGSFALDVRFCLRTDDGADILVTYVGIGQRFDDGSVRIRATPRFETGDDRYRWLNNVVAVALGEPTDEGVKYDVYAV